MSSPTFSQRDQGQLNWREVRVLYGREMRAALREKAIVLNSLFIPVFLYPLLLWAALSGIPKLAADARSENRCSSTVWKS